MDGDLVNSGIICQKTTGKRKKHVCGEKGQFWKDF